MSLPRAKYAYNRKRELGSGSFARVFLGSARTGADGSPTFKVAVKRVDLSKVSRNPKAQALIRNEITLLKKLAGHPNVVKLFDSYEDRRHLHLVLEYCDGGDLGKHLRKHAPLPEPTIHDLLSQLARGIQHLRAHDVVHRDLKPQNILLCADPTRPSGYVLKLIDFGFATQLTATDLTATYCGSPLFMAPEVVTGQAYDPKIDLWAVGTVAYQMATGTTPFRAKSIGELRRKLNDAEAADRRLAVPGHLSPEFAALVQGLLRISPGKRLAFEAFYAHPFFHKHFPPPAPDAPSADADFAAAAVEASVAPPVCCDPGSYVVVDRRVTEFAERLDKLKAHGDPAADAAEHNSVLRELARRAVARATLVLHAAEGGSAWERLVLHGRALTLLRNAMSRGREHIAGFEAAPGPLTAEAALRFRDCMEHCVAGIDALRAAVADTDEQRSPFDMLLGAALRLSERATRHADARETVPAGVLYRAAITLLGVVRDERPDDAERIDRLVQTTEHRMNAASSRCSVALSSMRNDSMLLGTSSVATSPAASTVASSKPIPIPGGGRAAAAAAAASATPLSFERARFCWSCGMRYQHEADRYCSMCGTQRHLVGSSVSGSAPSSLR